MRWKHVSAGLTSQKAAAESPHTPSRASLRRGSVPAIFCILSFAATLMLALGSYLNRFLSAGLVTFSCALFSLALHNQRIAREYNRQIEETERQLRETKQRQDLSDYLQQLATRLAGESDCSLLLPQIVQEVCEMGYPAASILLNHTAPDGSYSLTGQLVTPLPHLPSLPMDIHTSQTEITSLLQSPVQDLSAPCIQEFYPREIREALQVIGARTQLTLALNDQNQQFGLLLVWASEHGWGQHLGVWPPDEDMPSQGASYTHALLPFRPTAMRFLAALSHHVSLALRNERMHRQTREANTTLEQQHQAAMEQTGALMEMNSELMAVQNELQAQYLALEAANAQLAALATTDGMTSLANHRRFQEEIARQIARAQRAQAPLSLLLLDVDHFKKYNDQFGHPAGDVILKQVGRILQDIVREGDFPARYGGEEFAVILPDTEANTASQVAERIRSAVASESFPHRDITVSIGLTQYLPGETAPVLIQRADVALYEAKSAGRNCVSIFTPSPLLETEGSKASTIDTAVSVSPEEVAASCLAGNIVLEGGPESRAALCWPDSEQEQNSLLLTIRDAHDGGLEGLLQDPPVALLSELLALLDRRHVQPPGHSRRTARFALRLAHQLIDYYEDQRPTRPLLPRLTSGDLMQLTYGALLHDIGKSGIPDEILRKEGKLTDDEWRQIRRHPLVGVELLASSSLLSRAIPVVRFHHERWDGTGYPQGLAQDARSEE